MSKGPQVKRRVQRNPPRQGSGRWANDRASRRRRTPPTSSWQRSQSTQPKAAWNTLASKIRIAVDQVTPRQAQQTKARVPTRGLGLHPTHGPPRPKGRGGSSYSHRARASARASPRRQAAARRPHPQKEVHAAPGSSPRVRNAARPCPSRNRTTPSARRPPRHRASRPRAAFLWRTAPGRTEDLPPPSSASWPTTAGGGGQRPGRASTKRADCASRGPPRGPSPVPSAGPRSPAVPRRGGPGGRRPAAPWCRPHRPTNGKSPRPSSCRACPRARGDAAVPAGGTVRRLPCASARRSRDARRGRRGP